MFLVFVIIFAIYIFAVIYNPDYLIRDSVSLNIANSSQSVIPIVQIDNPGSTRYFYETWIYINANMPTNSQNVLFNRENDFVVTLNGSTMNLYINTTSGKGAGVSKEGVLDTSGIQPLLSVPNFPFQKWAQVVINVDGTTVDFYIDGKYVQNVKSTTMIGTSPTAPITYGNQHTTGKLTRFRRPATSINPQGVWNSYMLGSGQNTSITNYHVNAQLTKNKQVRVDQRII
jgi:hypothetical protein